MSPIGTVRLGKIAWRSRPTISRISSARPASAAGRVAIELAVAEDRHAIGERGDLLEPVGDVDDADASGPQVADQSEQPIGLSIGESRGRLVHQNDPCVRAQSARDFDELLLCHPQPVGRSVDVDVRADSGEHLARPLASPAPVDPSPGSGGLVPDRKIFGDRQVREERRLLINRRDAERAHRDRVGAIDPARVDLNRPRVRRVRAREDAHERALSGAVLADERMDLASLQVERHGPERVHAAERFAHASEPDEGHGMREGKPFIAEWRMLNAEWAMTRMVPDVSQDGGARGARARRVGAAL